MIEIIGGAFAAGETKTFHINGGYLEVVEAQYTCDIFLMDRAGAQLSVMRGCEASFFSRPAEGFNTVQITSAQAQTIRVFIGSGDAGTRRVSGVVNVIDGGKARTLSGLAATAAVTVAPVAAKNAIAGVWNPAGSGRRVVVKNAYISTATVQYVYMGRISVAPANLGAPQTLLFDGAAYAGAARACSDTLTGVGSLSAAGAFAQAGSPMNIRLEEPIVVRPGFGLVFAAGAANTDLTVMMPFFEEVE